MEKKPILITGGNFRKPIYNKSWQFLTDQMTKTAEARKKFFEDCDKLFITHDGDTIQVDAPDLNTEDIVKLLTPNADEPWNKSVKKFDSDIQKIITACSVTEGHAACYLCNFEDEVICIQFNGGCPLHDKCKAIHATLPDI